MKHGFCFYFWFVPVFETFEQMYPSAYQDFTKTCYEPKELEFRQLFHLFNIKSWQKKLLSFFLRTEEVNNLRVFWRLFWERNEGLPSLNAVLTAKSWSFIQFVRLFETYEKIQKLYLYNGVFFLYSTEVTDLQNKLLAIAYLPENQVFDEEQMRIRAKELSNLNPYLRVKFLEKVGKKFEALIKRHKKIFPKDEKENEFLVSSKKHTWLSVIRALADNNPVNFEPIALMDADLALFHLEKNMEDQPILKQR